MSALLLRVALTGGIATGKSYCLRKLQALGALTIDADTLARQAVRPGSAGLTAVVEHFGPRVLQPNGELDRAALGEIVFRDRDSRQALEAIVHPVVYAELEAWFATIGTQTGAPPAIAIADIPLLFETGRERTFDVVVVAACTAAQQLERLMGRDGLSRDDALRRIAAQRPIDEKRQKADLVIDTSGTLADTDRRIADVWARLRQRAEVR